MAARRSPRSWRWALGNVAKGKASTALLDLMTRPPPVTHAQVMQLRADLLALQNGAATARTFIAAAAPGADLLALVRADRAEAIEYAADGLHASLLAQRYRQIAHMLDVGAKRIQSALVTRDDQLEVITDATRTVNDRLAALRGTNG